MDLIHRDFSLQSRWEFDAQLAALSTGTCGKCWPMKSRKPSPEISVKTIWARECADRLRINSEVKWRRRPCSLHPNALKMAERRKKGGRGDTLSKGSRTQLSVVFISISPVLYNLPEPQSRRSTVLHPHHESNIWNILRSDHTAASRSQTTSLWVKTPCGAGCTGTCGSDL